MVVKVTDVLRIRIRIRRSGGEVVERRRENDFDSPFVLLFQFKVHVVRVVVVRLEDPERATTLARGNVLRLRVKRGRFEEDTSNSVSCTTPNRFGQSLRAIWQHPRV